MGEPVDPLDEAIVPVNSHAPLLEQQDPTPIEEEEAFPVRSRSSSTRSTYSSQSQLSLPDSDMEDPSRSLQEMGYHPRTDDHSPSRSPIPAASETNFPTRQESPQAEIFQETTFPVTAPSPQPEYSYMIPTPTPTDDTYPSSDNKSPTMTTPQHLSYYPESPGAYSNQSPPNLDPGRAPEGPYLLQEEPTTPNRGRSPKQDTLVVGRNHSPCFNQRVSHSPVSILPENGQHQPSMAYVPEDRHSAKNTLLSYRTDRTGRTEDPDTRARRRKVYRSATTHLLCGLYALILVTLGMVFSTSSALTEKGGQDTFYLQVLMLYVFGMSLILLAYFHCCLLRHRKSRVDGSLRRVNLVSNNQIDQQQQHADKTSADYNPEMDLTLTKDKRSIRSRSHCSDFDDVMDGMSTAFDNVNFDADGVNFYLRLGAIGFGIGSMIHQGFRIASLFENGHFNLDCRGPLYVAVALTHMVFTFFQTFYLFKNHKIVINKHKAFVRFGFMHMIAANICTWCMTTVYETAQQFRNEPTSVRVLTHGENGTVDEDWILKNCSTIYQDSLAAMSSPYLFPCTIEYSLIAAAMLYKMYRNVGAVGKHHFNVSVVGDDIFGQNIDCHKANKGLFLGLFVAVLTLIAVSLFFVFDQELFDYASGSLIFFGAELFLLFLSITVVLVGFARIQKLRFSPDAPENSLDSLLLVLSYFGICTFNTFLVISSLRHMLSPFNLMALLSLATAAAALIQGALQTVFILDGLRRYVGSERHLDRKPGREMVTFLLLCNLSLWLINTFEFKKVDSLPMHQDFFGELPWSIVSHACIPLLIFFRFHSTVCLSDIWVNAYRLRKKEI